MARVRRFAVLLLLLVAGVGAVLFIRLRTRDRTLTFTREDLQRRVATKFPFDQKMLLFTITYSDPVVKLEDGSDRIGIGLDAAAKLAGSQLVKGRVEGDWQLRYEPTEGALYLDDPKISRFDIQGLPPSTQGTIAMVARPLVQEYLRRVPVYKVKPRERGTLRSVKVEKGRLVVVLGSG
ncbi:MAG: DUF1439 domain-containing protein [Fimbriimonas ginsengisoli]|uniref:DUF1439 domain-containing protein n=1 Tax=Fimbriimonas ginsengisoli TaxID=1005039 RepID=A0A931LSG3_FIMGI|nr:DUF1439 domain-containing protein [Fimbriimonas ginsengisoli]